MFTVTTVMPASAEGIVTSPSDHDCDRRSMLQNYRAFAEDYREY
jgi:hypothetical protein